MFQRLKGAIDSRIAEEQARQRQAALSAQPTRNNPRRRPQGQNEGSQTRQSRRRDDSIASLQKSPDPSEFEPEFTIGDDESAVPSRVGTPKPEMKEKHQESGEERQALQTSQEGQETGASSEATVDKKPAAADGDGDGPGPLRPQELPAEVRGKLRKLDRIEARYAELLKAYRTAHSRIQAVESFEASLRENTPLSSINDPGALVEYLNQINLKSDMVLDELKRVTTDRDDYKKKLEASEEENGKMRGELTELKSKSATVTTRPETVEPVDETRPAGAATTTTGDGGTMAEAAEPESIAKSPASTSSRIAGFSLFSPRSKPAEESTKESPEELFSFDSEHAKLEAQLHERETEVEDLKKQVDRLNGDLKVARESTEGMVQSLETATSELHSLREAKDKFEETKADLQNKLDEAETKAASGSDLTGSLEKEIEVLKVEKGEASVRIQELESRIKELETDNATLKDLLHARTADTNLLNEKLSQKDAVVKDLEDTLSTYKSVERQQTSEKNNGQGNEKKLATMQNIMNTLRQQLDKAEKTVEDLRAQVQSNQEDFSRRPSTTIFGFLDEDAKVKLDTLKSREDVVNYLSENFGLQKSPGNKTGDMSAAPSPAPSEAAASTKKKNKKKKKGKGPQPAVNDSVDASTPIKVSENLAEIEDAETGNDKPSGPDISRLEQEINNLKAELSDKVDAVERLSRQLKDQEALQEEIETLRDDLLHQGEEHVEARDALKDAQAQKDNLQAVVMKLEADLSEARKAAATAADAEKAHTGLHKQYDELKGKCANLERDLGASEQLATARFKDITDLKELLSKAQPELRNLRNEVSELKSAKEDLKNKTGELNRLEARHEDIKAELKGLGKRLGDKDVEIKELQLKIEQETNTRTRVEKDLEKAQEELQTAESRRQEAAASADQLKQDLAKAKEESTSLKVKLRDLEEQLSVHTRQVTELKEELNLKTALHSSSQSLVQSLRDQTHELTMQAREATNRADSLEEELTEAQRMLSERTREGQTMRMLLDQAETGTEARIREMKERMEAAIEERDRVEDEANVSNRRMMREVEDARSKTREAQRALKVVQDEKDELENRQREWKRRRDELEQAAERAAKEVEEVRAAMAGLREALDESERQIRELDTQKMDLRRTADEARERVEKLTKANKNLTEELKAAQSGARNHKGQVGRPGPGLESGIPSSRTSVESLSARSPTPKERGLSTSTSRSETPSATGLSQGTVDYVYLKNVLLQFLEQKDKSHQRQLIPVLGMLLHFDR
ncbi:hypothetical protein A1O1_02854 [Capronia coronata CBS 617.96]|uniref:GRIP domain-containing protein n=1 Tax=Capronia coronata CBS 617.96 TaxID=1182541 RepID=W9YPJ3_9EURO|nr:uncharacterized protein A1O1_02854 [Capronia coronata CBS 617.96]EXJ94458.1 hypothetical protein A1O1_02854 [Capronia coronata CBS 617.96]